MQKDERDILFSMTYVVTAGGNVTEIVVKMKHIPAMLQLVQLVRKIWVCASNIEEGGQAETVQGQEGRVPFNVRSHWIVSETK